MKVFPELNHCHHFFYPKLETLFDYFPAEYLLVVDEENNVKVFKVSTKSDIGVYGGNKGTLTNILFINENEFFVSSESTTINFYKLR